MKVLCFGDRNWTNEERIREVLAAFPEGTTIVHGDNGYDLAGNPLWGKPDSWAVRGADKLCGKVARELGFNVEVYTPDWGRYHERAGPIRNQTILKFENPDLAVCFHSNLAESKGSKDMLGRCYRWRVEVRIYV